MPNRDSKITPKHEPEVRRMAKPVWMLRDPGNKQPIALNPPVTGIGDSDGWHAAVHPRGEADLDHTCSLVVRTSDGEWIASCGDMSIAEQRANARPTYSAMSSGKPSRAMRGRKR
jgi:hypothetical protein